MATWSLRSSSSSPASISSHLEVSEHEGFQDTRTRSPKKQKWGKQEREGVRSGPHQGLRLWTDAHSATVKLKGYGLARMSPQSVTCSQAGCLDNGKVGDAVLLSGQSINEFRADLQLEGGACVFKYGMDCLV